MGSSYFPVVDPLFSESATSEPGAHIGTLPRCIVRDGPIELRCGGSRCTQYAIAFFSISEAERTASGVQSSPEAANRQYSRLEKAIIHDSLGPSARMLTIKNMCRIIQTAQRASSFFLIFIEHCNHLRQGYSRLNAMMLSGVLFTFWRLIQYVRLIGSGLISRGHPSSHQAKYPWLDQIQIGMVLRHLRSSRRPDQSETIQRREVNCDPRSLKIP